MTDHKSANSQSLYPKDKEKGEKVNILFKLVNLL